MKTFVKENWYKLMIGSSMFVFSVSALIYSVSPARAENVFKAKSNSALTYLTCEENQLTSLDVSKNNALTELGCYDNKFDCDALKRKYGIKN